MRKDEQEQFDQLRQDVQGLGSTLDRLVDEVQNLKRLNVPELLPRGTYKVKVVDVERKDGRTQVYWTAKLEALDYPGKYLWLNYPTRRKWFAVRDCETLGIPVPDGVGWFDAMIVQLEGKECLVDVVIEPHFLHADKEVNRAVLGLKRARGE